MAVHMPFDNYQECSQFIQIYVKFMQMLYLLIKYYSYNSMRSDTCIDFAMCFFLCIHDKQLEHVSDLCRN